MIVTLLVMIQELIAEHYQHEASVYCRNPKEEALERLKPIILVFQALENATEGDRQQLFELAQAVGQLFATCYEGDEGMHSENDRVYRPPYGLQRLVGALERLAEQSGAPESAELALSDFAQYLEATIADMEKWAGQHSHL